MDPAPLLHPPLHPRAAAAAGRLLVLARLSGLAVVDVEVALTSRHAGPTALLVILAVLATGGALMWSCGLPRRDWSPVAARALMAGAGGLLAALQHGSAALAFAGVATAQVVADGLPLEAVCTCALALVALESGVLWARLDASAALGYPAILLGCGLVGLTRLQYMAQTRAAQALVTQTQRTEAESRRAAALDERTRIAREIHDVLAHALGGLTVQLQAAELLLAQRGDVDAALERIRGCQRTAREGLQEARRAVAALRSDTPALKQSLTALLESHREQGQHGELFVEGDERDLSPEASLTLMRTAQEALTNARRHAPGSAVTVHLAYGPASTSVTVTNGRPDHVPVATGPAEPSGGYGLAGMRERLELAGGRLMAGPSAGGWTVSAEVPA